MPRHGIQMRGFWFYREKPITIIPPFSSHGPYYSGFPTYDLPFDLSYIGTAHSHPSSSNKPSLEDLNNYYGVVSVIISHPYADTTIGAFDRNGNSMELEILSSTTDWLCTRALWADVLLNLYMDIYIF